MAWLLVAIGAVLARSSLPLSLPSTIERLVIELASAVLVLAGAWWLANVVAVATAIRRGRPLPTVQLPGARRVAQGFLLLTMTTSCVANDTTPRMVHVGALEAASEDPGEWEDVPSPSATELPATTMPPATIAPSSIVEPLDPPIVDDADVPPVDTGAATTTEDSATSDADVGAPTTATDIDEHQLLVQPGDNLWSLAEGTLIAHGVNDPSCAEIADYWRDVLATNRVRSGDPNLIVPGEAITMPAHRIGDAADAVSGAPMESAPASAGSDPYGFHHR